MNQRSRSNDILKKPILWKPDKSENYIENFDTLKVAEIECKLDFLIDTNNITDESINDVVNSINHMYESCATKSFGYKTIKQKDKYSNFKPWFNKACITDRNLYHKTRKMYNRYKNDYYKNRLKMVSKVKSLKGIE